MLYYYVKYLVVEKTLPGPVVGEATVVWRRPFSTSLFMYVDQLAKGGEARANSLSDFLSGALRLLATLDMDFFQLQRLPALNFGEGVGNVSGAGISRV
jgi:hypothetical protein